MSEHREIVTTLTMATISDIGSQLGLNELGGANESTPLYGSEGGIDSLSLAMLITAVEQAINQHFNSNVLLASEKAMSMRNSPYRSVATLIEFATQELDHEATHG